MHDTKYLLTIRYVKNRIEPSITGTSYCTLRQ